MPPGCQGRHGEGGEGEAEAEGIYDFFSLLVSEKWEL